MANDATPFDATPAPVENKALRVIAVVEQAETTRQCLALAAEATRGMSGATLTVLHIEADPTRIVSAPEEISLQRLRIPEEGTSRDRAMRVHQTFDQWVAFSGNTTATWLHVAGSVEATLRQEARAADLIVIARPHNLDSGDALHAAIFDTGKLVMYVPERAAGRRVFIEHLAIIWRPDMPTRRAVHHSMPWLRAAGRVTVLSPDDAGSNDEVSQMLNAEGVLHDMHRHNHTAGDHIGTELLREAHEINASGLIIGAYRFGMVLEWLFDSMTQRILTETTLPILMMH
ncbi:hypothetical protein ATER59S_00455 [Aquamicrobium terrae]